jgi:hypothetical protein
MTTPGAVAPAPSTVPAAPVVPAERVLRLGLVALFSGFLAAAVLLPPVAPGAEGGLTLAGVRLPEVCALQRAAGLPCPGCGLTRSWVSALHARPAESLAHHPLGWLVLLYVAAQLGRHAAWLTLPRRRPAVERLGRPLDRGVIALGVLLLVAWVPRILGALGAL